MNVYLIEVAPWQGGIWPENKSRNNNVRHKAFCKSSLIGGILIHHLKSGRVALFQHLPSWKTANRVKLAG